MKKVILILILSVSLVTAPNPATAGEREKAKIGIGASIGKEPYFYDYDGNWNLAVVDFPSIYVPVQLNRNFRIEPQIGYAHWKQTADGETEGDFSILDTGLGFFYTCWNGPVDIYVGVRLGIQWIYYFNWWMDRTLKRRAFYYGPGIGGEYFLTHNFSIGGEVQFNFLDYGKWKYDGHSLRTKDRFQKTKTLFFMRFYFGRKDKD